MRFVHKYRRVPRIRNDGFGHSLENFKCIKSRGNHYRHQGDEERTRMVSSARRGVGECIVVHRPHSYRCNRIVIPHHATKYDPGDVRSAWGIPRTL
jgi:hypothetical protein